MESVEEPLSSSLPPAYSLGNFLGTSETLDRISCGDGIVKCKPGFDPEYGPELRGVLTGVNDVLFGVAGEVQYESEYSVELPYPLLLLLLLLMFPINFRCAEEVRVLGRRVCSSFSSLMLRLIAVAGGLKLGQLVAFRNRDKDVGID